MAEFDEFAPRQNTRVMPDSVDPYIRTQLASITDDHKACVESYEAGLFISMNGT